MKKTALILLITFLLTGHFIYAQGCNDAGLCSMGDLARGDDAMFRLNRFFYTKKNRFNAGLLALYRIQEDKVTQGDNRIALDNSDGLTLNINLGYQKVLKNEDAITLSFAAPIITREVRVDGLTRTFVVMFTYAFGNKKKNEVFQPVKFSQ